MEHETKYYMMEGGNGKRVLLQVYGRCTLHLILGQKLSRYDWWRSIYGEWEPGPHDDRPKEIAKALLGQVMVGNIKEISKDYVDILLTFED